MNLLEGLKYKKKWDKVKDIEQCSAEYLRAHIHGVEWTTLCTWRKFTEEELREFKDYVNWYVVIYQDNLSADFKREFKDKFQ